MRKSFLARLLIGAALAATLGMSASAFAASSASDVLEAQATATAAPASAGAELAKVQKLFPQATVFEADANNFYDQMGATRVHGVVTAECPVIVHVTGSVEVNNLNVPRNVILVGESSTTYTYDGSGGAGTAAIRLEGSIFGGKFVGKNAHWTVRALGLKGNAINGHIQDATFNGGYYAVGADGKSSGIQVVKCKVSGTEDCSIQATNGSTLKLVSGCTITNCGESGIDLIHANATTITKNTIKECKSHGISTDTEHASVCPNQKTCKIGTISNNKISHCGYHGIYVEGKCTVKAIKGNRIFNNKRSGINVAGTAEGIANNKIYKNKKSNLIAAVKGKVDLKGGNKIYSSKEHGISVSAGGKLYIKGANNDIYNNAKNGVNVANKGSQFVSTGKNLKIRRNKNNGLSFSLKAKGSVSNARFSGNKKVAVYVSKGCKLTAKKCNLSKSKKAKNRLYIAK